MKAESPPRVGKLRNDPCLSRAGRSAQPQPAVERMVVEAVKRAELAIGERWGVGGSLSPPESGGRGGSIGCPGAASDLQGVRKCRPVCCNRSGAGHCLRTPGGVFKQWPPCQRHSLNIGVSLDKGGEEGSPSSHESHQPPIIAGQWLLRIHRRQPGWLAGLHWLLKW